jgi:hypothetical protein
MGFGSFRNLSYRSVLKFLLVGLPPDGDPSPPNWMRCVRNLTHDRVKSYGDGELPDGFRKKRASLPKSPKEVWEIPSLTVGPIRDLTEAMAGAATDGMAGLTS